MARLQEFYRAIVVPRLREDLKIENAMQVPRITKITINMGVGEPLRPQGDGRRCRDLTKISGQKPLITKSRKGDRILQAACGTCRGREG